MRLSCYAVVILALAPRVVAAQSAAGGVDALLRGDYQTAVRVLRPPRFHSGVWPLRGGREIVESHHAACAGDVP